MRAALQLAASREDGPLKAEAIADAQDISIADVIRIVDGPLVSLRGVRPPELSYTGPAESLLPLWIALRSNVREILEGVSLADVASAQLPAEVSALSHAPGAWVDP
ncbi:hypothetical protein [Streptomyces sp. NPDC093598]|uniref:hypothetical protein n=1 Tax=Streptomyces sp. NPDC093598 TaxID=3366046 RepID=UPI00381C17D2